MLPGVVAHAHNPIFQGTEVELRALGLACAIKL